MLMNNCMSEITEIKEIPITNDSYPFCSAERMMQISRLGYEEKEYYMYGTANVYKTEEDGTIGIRYNKAPYINRFVMRAPQNQKKFSGNIIIEILNATSGMDIERMWIFSNKEFIRNGDIYIGISSKPNTIAKLKEFNQTRYEKLNWKNPTSSQQFPYTREEILQMENILPDQDINVETGLFWDMLTDLALLLKQNNRLNVLCDYQVKNVILTGWSQSANYMIRYINDFAYLKEREKPIFDGYLLAGPPRWFNVPVNQYEAVECNRKDQARIRRVDQPCIVMQTESENSMLGAHDMVREDGDDPNYQIRHYDITGASHDTKETLLDVYENDADIERINMQFKYNGKNKVPNNYPTKYLVSAAFRNLIYWINMGVAPQTCERIQTDWKGNNCKDTFGITKGGIRTCILDYPTSSFYNYSDIEKGSNAIFPHSDKDFLFGHEEPFSKEFLQELYGSIENYRLLVQENTKKQVKKGFILEADAEDIVEDAVKRARVIGLK